MIDSCGTVHCPGCGRIPLEVVGGRVMCDNDKLKNTFRMYFVVRKNYVHKHTYIHQIDYALVLYYYNVILKCIYMKQKYYIFSYVRCFNNYRLLYI